MKEKQIKWIPFYGGENPDLFEIERRCMDRAGKVIQYLDEMLPNGFILDVGAGNGFTAEKLQQENRQIVALEPDEKMIDLSKPLVWSKGVAQNIPFHEHTFDAVYSTWAFFFDGTPDIEDGLKEVERVLLSGGNNFLVDDYANDVFCYFSTLYISSNVSFSVNRGFDYGVIYTQFIFDSIDEAQKILS